MGVSIMDRRRFLTGLLGIAGVATLARVAHPVSASAGVPSGMGIIDELKDDVADTDATAEPELVAQRHRHPRHNPRNRHRRPRRRVRQRVCRRYRYHGRLRTRCRYRWVYI